MTSVSSGAFVCLQAHVFPVSIKQRIFVHPGPTHCAPLPSPGFCLPPRNSVEFLLFRHHSEHTTATGRSVLAWDVSLKAHAAEKWPRSPWLQPSLCLPVQTPITNERQTLDSQKRLPFLEARRESNFGWLLNRCHSTVTPRPAV